MNEVNLLRETLITFAAAGRIFPGARGGKSTNPSTVHRWAMSGAKAPDGTRVVLETIRIGGRTLTSF